MLIIHHITLVITLSALWPFQRYAFWFNTNDTKLGITIFINISSGVIAAEVKMQFNNVLHNFETVTLLLLWSCNIVWLIVDIDL
jgi:hypothetical protein